MNVLIADDSDLMFDRLTNLISGIEGLRVVGRAIDCQGATESIHRLHPDVVILDIRMPGGSGIEVLKNIRNDDIPVVKIILTNYPYPQYRQICNKLGADYFFDKSKDFTEIHNVLKRLIKDTAIS